MGLVYTRFRRIDALDRIIDTGEPWEIEGQAFLRHLLVNFVGNGSGALFRREALVGIGGFDAGLRAAGLEGTEDYLAQLLVARSWTIGVVPEYLTGYRFLPVAMSANRGRMWRSRLAMVNLVRRRCPGAPEDVLDTAEAAVRAELALHCLLGERAPHSAFETMNRALSLAPRATLAVGWHALCRRLRAISKRRLGIERPQPNATPFLCMDPKTGPEQMRRHPLDPWITAYALREADVRVGPKDRRETGRKRSPDTLLPHMI